jgi:high affinity Mn2+ porin
LSGEAYKVGASTPYFRIPRLFFRQSFDLGGDAQTLAPGANQLGGTLTADNIVVTSGKFGVTDIFDTNRYAHDPRADFLNWAIIDAGAFDYAADSWAYSYGTALEWTQSWRTFRLGVFNLSKQPNSRFLQRDFSQFELLTEIEGRTELDGHPGKVKLLGYVNRGRMADYSDAVRAAIGTPNPPDVANLRNYRSRPGITLNLEQEIGPDWGVFARASLDDGSKEAYEFTEINKSVSAGAAFNGERWGRATDTVGFAGVVNGISKSAQAYFAAGGIGLLIGDGKLVHYRPEDILEAYYSAVLFTGVTVSLDYQYVVHPAYNADRGPVSVFAFRLHTEI